MLQTTTTWSILLQLSLCRFSFLELVGQEAASLLALCTRRRCTPMLLKYVWLTCKFQESQWASLSYPCHLCTPTLEVLMESLMAGLIRTTCLPATICRSTLKANARSGVLLCTFRPTQSSTKNKQLVQLLD